MTLSQVLITVLLFSIGTIICRYTPFVVFKDNTPKYVQYLGNALPPAIFAMLVVYCLKDIDITFYSYGLPELISILGVIGIHLWKRNTLVSIIFGTVLYMILIQMVF